MPQVDPMVDDRFSVYRIDDKIFLHDNKYQRKDITLRATDCVKLSDYFCQQGFTKYNQIEHKEAIMKNKVVRDMFTRDTMRLYKNVLSRSPENQNCVIPPVSQNDLYQFATLMASQSELFQTAVNCRHYSHQQAQMLRPVVQHAQNNVTFEFY